MSLEKMKMAVALAALAAALGAWAFECSEAAKAKAATS